MEQIGVNGPVVEVEKATDSTHSLAVTFCTGSIGDINPKHVPRAGAHGLKPVTHELEVYLTVLCPELQLGEGRISSRAKARDT